MKRLWVWVFPALFFLMPPPVSGAPTVLPRTILGIYDSTEDYNRKSDDNLIHNNAEMVLNHLGMKVRLHDIASGLPAADSMDDIYGILTWFRDDAIAHAEAFTVWITEQIQKGKKVIVLKTPGSFFDAETGEKTPRHLITRFYEALGLRYGGDWTDNPLVIEVLKKDGDMVEFERSLKMEVTVYEKIKALNSDSRVYLKLGRTDTEDSESDVVVTTPQGGLALEDYVILLNYIDDKVRWRLNPFLFFNEALGIQKWPRFDTTTLFGRRISYIHIDGDGFRNISTAYPRRISAEVIHEKILKAYDFPTTVSYVTADLNPDYFGSEKMIRLAREMSRLPHVETGVHGFSHPLDWQKKLTAYEIKDYSLRSEHDAEADSPVSESVYENASRVLVDDARFLQTEIEGAAAYLNQTVMPKGKSVVLNQWTGDCRPSAAAIRAAREAGLGNINGGDSRFDRSIPSYTGVAPLVRQIGGETQIYTSNANENIYTREWSGPFDGFREVMTTFGETEFPSLVRAVPRRVAPINLYYHFYSGEKQASLEALKEIYDYLESRDTIPIFTSEYTAVVEGFLQASIAVLDDGGWHLSGYGADRTLRFDQNARFPDLKKSKGVLGFTHWQDYLYVYLTEKGKATLYLSNEAPREPYLKEAGTILSETQISREKVIFLTRGHRNAYYHFENMTPEAVYQVTVVKAGNGQRVLERSFRSGPDGGLRLQTELPGEVRVEIVRV